MGQGFDVIQQFCILILFPVNTMIIFFHAMIDSVLRITLKLCISCIGHQNTFIKNNLAFLRTVQKFSFVFYAAVVILATVDTIHFIRNDYAKAGLSPLYFGVFITMAVTFLYSLLLSSYFIRAARRSGRELQFAQLYLKFLSSISLVLTITAAVGYYILSKGYVPNYGICFMFDSAILILHYIFHLFLTFKVRNKETGKSF